MHFPLASGAVVAVMVAWVGVAEAGTITAVGAVTALTNAHQVVAVVGNGNFDEGPTSGAVPADVYAALGLTWRQGSLSSFLAGVTNTGSSFFPQYATSPQFPAPIGGGGTHVAQGGGTWNVATFTTPVTQVGLTASKNGTQRLTAWNAAGAMIGQVTWTPAGDSAFVGIDTNGVNIAMVAYGTNDVWAGQAYGNTGMTPISDSWVWATGVCTIDAHCDDGDACTVDACTVGTGVCSHTAKVCNAQDICHTAGTCDSNTGACSQPAKPDGAACNDANACTQTDTCQAGNCVGANPVVCAAKDGCHDIGVCDPINGVCTAPPKANGSACTDGNACTQTDTCQAGVCSGANPVVCPPADQCHTQGTCDMGTGTCSQPPKANGAACDDADMCTLGDTCQAGACTSGAPKTCAASTCHTAGTCNPASGACTSAASPDGTACTGGTCTAGMCTTADAGAPASDSGAADAATTTTDAGTTPTPHPDAGDVAVVDAGTTDGAIDDGSASSGGCSTAGSNASPLGWLAALVAIACSARRRRR